MWQKLKEWWHRLEPEGQKATDIENRAIQKHVAAVLSYDMLEGYERRRAKDAEAARLRKFAQDYPPHIQRCYNYWIDFLEKENAQREKREFSKDQVNIMYQTFRDKWLKFK